MATFDTPPGRPFKGVCEIHLSHLLANLQKNRTRCSLRQVGVAELTRVLGEKPPYQQPIQVESQASPDLTPDQTADLTVEVREMIAENRQVRIIRRANFVPLIVSPIFRHIKGRRSVKSFRLLSIPRSLSTNNRIFLPAITPKHLPLSSIWSKLPTMKRPVKY